MDAQSLGAFMKSYDIGESNQRQSDFYWGCNDAEDGIAPRCEREAYLEGYRFSKHQGYRRTDAEAVYAAISTVIANAEKK